MSKTIQVVVDGTTQDAVNLHRELGGFESLSKAAGDLIQKGATLAIETYANQKRFERILIAEGLASTPAEARRLSAVAPQLARILEREGAV